MPKSQVTEFDPNDLYPAPEDVALPVELIGCKQVTVEFKYKQGKRAGETGSFLKWEWEFRVYDGPYAGVNFRGTTEPKITNATETDFLPPALPIVEALLGRSLQVGEEIDTDDLISLKAQASVKHLEPRARKNGDGFWYNVELNEIFPAATNAMNGGLTPNPNADRTGAADPWGQQAAQPAPAQDPWGSQQQAAYPEPPY